MGCRLEKKTSFTHGWQLPTEIRGIYKKPARLQVNLSRSHTKRSTCKNKVYFYILVPTAWNRIISPRSLRPLSPWVIPWKNSPDSAWVVLMSGIDHRGIMRRSHWIIRAKHRRGRKESIRGFCGLSSYRKGSQRAQAAFNSEYAATWVMFLPREAQERLNAQGFNWGLFTCLMCTQIPDFQEETRCAA